MVVVTNGPGQQAPQRIVAAGVMRPDLFRSALDNGGRGAEILPLGASLVQIVRQVSAHHDEICTEQVQDVRDVFRVRPAHRDRDVSPARSKDPLQERKLHLDGVLDGVRRI